MFHNRTGSDSNYRRWKKTMHHHGYEEASVDHQIRFFTANLRSQGYKWSSIAKTLADVQHCMRYHLPHIDKLRFLEARRFAKRQAVSEKVRKAPRWARED